MYDYRSYMQEAHSDFSFPPAAHHEVIIDAIHELEAGNYRRVLVMAPPGSAKSTYISVQFATWYMARHPDHHVLACSNTTDLAENFNRRRRNVCYSPEWQRLSGSQIQKDQQGVSRFGLTLGGTCTAAGVGSAIVGLRSHLNILDDPITSLEQAMSDTQLDKIWAWYETDYRSRLLPHGLEVVVTTRWSRKDPAGRILDLVESGEEEWLVVRLPMLCDDPVLDPLSRELNEPLWPQWFGQHQIDQNIKDPLRWSALYQQLPLDASGSWVAGENIHIVDEAPENLQIVVGIDLALSVGKGDYTVLVIGGLDEQRNLYIVDVIRERVSPDETVHRLFSVNDTYTPSSLLVEDDNASKVFIRLLLELAREKNKSLPIFRMPIRGRDKETRAAALRGYFLQRRVFLVKGAWNTDVIRELIEFPNSDHDDVVDAMGLIARRMAELPSPKVPVNTRPHWNLIPEDECLIRSDGTSNVRLDDLWSTRPKPTLRIG